jgi:hypothetical protein
VWRGIEGAGQGWKSEDSGWSDDKCHTIRELFARGKRMREAEGGHGDWFSVHLMKSLLMLFYGVLAILSKPNCATVPIDEGVGGR